jgi:hypothetical protein
MKQIKYILIEPFRTESGTHWLALKEKEGLPLSGRNKNLLFQLSSTFFRCFSLDSMTWHGAVVIASKSRLKYLNWKENICSPFNFGPEGFCKFAIWLSTPQIYYVCNTGPLVFIWNIETIVATLGPCRCYDRNFLRFSPIFDAFLKNQWCYHILSKTSSSLTEKTAIFLPMRDQGKRGWVGAVCLQRPRLWLNFTT